MTVAALTCILMLTGVSSCAVVTEMSLGRYTHLLMDASPDFPIRFLKIYSTLEAMQRFANGLHDDYEAVKAGVTLPWSTGPVEGHINRLKMLKRQMFGRARLDLLSRRFVRAPRHRQAHPPRPQEPSETSAGAAASLCLPALCGGRGVSRSRGSPGRVAAAGTG